MVNVGADMVIAFERGFIAELFVEETLGAVAVETEFFMAVQAGLVVVVEIVFRLAHQVEMAVMAAYQHMAEGDHQQHERSYHGK